MIRAMRTRLAALAAVGGLATAAHAQPQVEPPPPPANPAPVEAGCDKPVPVRIVRWAGGSVVLDGPEVIVRQAGTPGVLRVNGTGRSTSVVTNSGNGFGNTIVVGNGGGGLTVVKNARNGVGNRLILDPDDELLDLDLPAWAFPPAACKPAPADPVAVPKFDPPAAPALDPAMVPVEPAVYRGKANPFWAKKAWSDAHDCNLYWSAADRAWFRYQSADDTYRAVPAAPVP